MPLKPGTEPLGDREHRLSLMVKRRREHAALERQLAELALEEGKPLPSAPSATAAGDPTRLRGVPIIGRGVGGAIAGTRPGSDPLLRRLNGSRSAREIVRTTNGVCPGTDPEAELLANFGNWPERSFDGRPDPAGAPATIRNCLEHVERTQHRGNDSPPGQAG